MSSFKSSAIVVTNKASTVTPPISGDLSIVARNDHLQVFNGTTEQQLIYTSEVAGISGGLVPYTGATSDVELGAHKVTLDAVVFNNSSVASVPRQISWNEDDKTFNMGLTSEVTLQVGQESLTRVYNGTASTITNGQPVYITGITNDNPSVALASAVGSFGADPATVCAGIATESIAPSGTGFITNKGKVRGLNTSGYTTGQIIYLGETAGTFTAQTSGFAYATHINPLGYVGLVDAISGSVYVDVRDNESSLLSLSERETNVLLGNAASTGVYGYTGMTIATSASFTIPPLKGWIVENTGVYATDPYVINVIYPGATLPVTDIATQDFTYVFVDRNNVITQQATFPTPQDRRDKIWLGKIVHIDHANIDVINNTVDYETSPFSALRDMFTAIPLINDGVTPYPDGANLSFNKTAGSLYGMGISWTANQKSPNKVSLSASLPVSFRRATQTVINATFFTTIDPGNYDVGGVVTSIGGAGGSATNKRIYQFPTGQLIVQYGQTVYSNLTNAIAASQTESFVKHPATFGSAILIGILSVTKNCTDLTDTGKARFTPASAFGEVTGGTSGISTTTLQEAYDNSIQPEIITNSTLGAITIRNGSGINTDNIFELQNSSGLNVLTADGLGNLNVYSISGSSRLGISDYAGFLPSAATIHASKNTNTGIVLDTYSNIGAFSGLTVRNARGTNSAATATQSGDTLGFLGASGHTGSAFSTTSRANMYLQASQTWSTSANGTKISFRTTPNGTIVPVERFLLDHDGSVTIANISGASGSIVTHDATGKLLDSGVLLTDLATNSTVASISGGLVSLTGDQDISGTKTFTNSVVISAISGNGILLDTTAPSFGWRDITGQIIPDTGSTTPGKAAFRGGTIGAYAFGSGDQCDIPFHIPHDYVPGTDVYVHVHWSHNGTSIAGNAVFTVTATTANGFARAIFGAEKSQTITYNTTNIATTPRYIHRVDEIQLSNNGGTGNRINTNDIEVDGLILLNVTMTTLPTIGGGSPNEVFIFQIDIHYQSTNLSTKNKAPSFYP